MTNEAKRLERTAVIRLDHAREWLERQLHSTAVDIPRQFVYPLLADYALSETIECSRLASRVERLENLLKEWVELQDECDAYPTSDGHPVYSSRKLLAGAHAEEKK